MVTIQYKKLTQAVAIHNLTDNLSQLAILVEAEATCNFMFLKFLKSIL